MTIPIYGGGGGASFSFSRDRVNSNFESVQEQSGLFAGRGGFDVTVGNHTQLDGGAIASTAEADKNRLDTGTLGFSNIDNHAEYSASHSGGGFGTGGPIGMQMLSNLGGLALAGANQSGSSSGTTYAAVSDGTLIIRDRAGQQQDVSGLSRDTAGANSGALNPIFDREKVESRMQQAQLMSDIGAQALDIASTEGAIAATKAANTKVAEATEAVRRAKGSELAQASPNKAITQDDITQALFQSYYDEAMRTSPYGTGGAVRQGIQAVTAALQGVLAGNMAQALTGAAAPYLAEAIHRATTDAAGNTDVAANTLAHALLGAVVAQASGNNALAGAAGEAGGELAARALMEALYPGKKPSELNEEQKQYISTLATIAGGLAAGVVGNTGADAVQGAQSAQVAVENNYLRADQITSWLEKYKSASTDEERKKLVDVASKADATQQQKALNTQISKDYLVKQQDDLIKLTQSPGCDTDCQKLAQYSINQLTPVIDNYDELQRSNNIPKAAIATISLAIPVLSKAVSPAIGELLGSQAVAQRVIGAGIAGAANGVSQVQSIIRDPNEKFRISSLFIATLSGGLSEGMKAPGTVVISTAGAGIDSVISGKNPLPPMIGAAGGSLGGYYVGYGVEKLGDKYINPWKNGFKDYRDPAFPSIINPPKVSPIPSISGAAAGSYFSERAGKFIEDNASEKIK